MLRPRICYVLSLLRIHNPDCKHCAAHLICGNELRKRLEELNEPMQAISESVFQEAGGIAVNVKTKNSYGVRVVQIPAVLQTVKRRNAA